MDEQRKFCELYHINAEEYQNVDIDDILFSVRVNNRLHREGIETVGALLNCTYERLAGLSGFGAGCFKEIYDYLETIKPCDDKAFDKIRVEKVVVPEALLQNRESVVKGDFSFVTEEMGDVVDLYMEAQQVLQAELAQACIDNPIYCALIRKTMRDFVDTSEKVREILNNIPADRKVRSARYYINACYVGESRRNLLLEKLRDEDVSLETYIREYAKEICDGHPLIANFAKACAFDIYEMTKVFFDEVKKNERSYEIVKMRASGQTLEQVGNTYFVTRERVRQIERKVSQRFTNWAKRNNIMQLIVAEEDGNEILLPSVFDVHFKEYAEMIEFLLKTYESDFENIHYQKALDVFVIGDTDVLVEIQDFVDELPDQFNEDEIEEILTRGYELKKLPKQLVYRAIENDYRKTGDVYHCSRLTLGKLYSDVLRNHYANGIWIYSDEALDGFRRHVVEDFGDIKMPENNRALVGRIAAVGILCGRGMYGPKKEKYISDELADKIHEYINESDSPIFLTNTLFSVFEEELISEGITNKYYLQGVLRELFEDEYVFRRDYISKDKNITSVYSEIVSYIEHAQYPVTKQQVNDAFPGVTEIVINISVSDPEIINLFGAYIHAKKLKLNKEDLQYIDKVMEKMFSRNESMHCKDIYEYVMLDNLNILTSNGIYQAFGLYSILEYLYRDQYEFSRPYIGRKGVEITRTYDQLHEMVQESDTIELSDVVAVARENHFQINSILEFANSCNSSHLLINDKELAAIEFTGITEDIVEEVELCILKELNGTQYVTNLQCAYKFPKINTPWTEWLIYSAINKWGTRLEVAVTSTTFKQAKAVIAKHGLLDMEKIEDNISAGAMYMPDDMDNIDELISDILFDEIEE